MDGYNSRYQENDKEETISLCDFSLNSDEQDSDEEETISLRDFSLYSDEHDRHETEELRRCQDLTSQPEKTEFFEFSSNYNSTMSHAEDIINCGKLIPFKGQNHSVSSIDDSALCSRRCHSESSTESKRGRMKMRTSKSVDFQKLSRNSITSSDSHGSSRFDGSSIKIPKPKWYILMFGNVKLPHEMDLQDIKNRQVQRTPSTLFPAALKVAEKAPTNRKSSWGVLNVLSCRDDVSVHVAGSLACMPRV